jgi:multiple sugar transport system permease protein
MLKTKGTKFFIFAFLVIPVIHLLIFSYIPILSNVFLSFTRYNGVSSPQWIGIRNYQRLLTDPHSIPTTMKYQN